MNESRSRIIISPHGPMKIEGTCEIRDANDCIISLKKDEILLCRCGHSCDKPFCDSSHKTTEWPVSDSF